MPEPLRIQGLQLQPLLLEVRLPTFPNSQLHGNVIIHGTFYLFGHPQTSPF